MSSVTLFQDTGKSQGDVEKQNDKPSGINTRREQSPDESAIATPNSDKNAQPQRTIRGFRWFLVCLAIFSANFLYGLDTTIAADIQAAVSESFDNVSQLGWLGVGFGLGSTVAILPLGKAYGIFDTKWLYIASLIMFSAASALCGAAPSMNAIIVGRVWAGAGGAGMYLGTINLVTMTSSPREAAFYVAFEGFVYGGGCILGPVVGGLLSDSAATWRWAFYLNLVLFAVTSPIYIFALPSLPRQPDTSFMDKIKKLDWLGIVLTAALYSCFVCAFTFGGPEWAWNDARFIVLVVLFVVFLATFAVTQHYAVFTTKEDRLFPCEFLGNLQLVLIYIGMACGGAGLFVAVYYIPLYFLFVHGDTGTEAAIRLLPFICFYITAIMGCGYAMPRTGYPMIYYLLSGVLLTAGGAAMYTIKADSPASHTYGFSALVGFGLTISQAGYAVAGGIVKPERMADVIQFLNISQGQSQMLGLAIASAIFQSKAFEGMSVVLDGQGFTTEEIRAAIAGSQSKVLQSISPELRERCLNVLVETIADIWIMVIVAGALLTICACFMSRKRF
ncbi:major facilitator superfamily domain-containing protein [Ilyonectria robusta]|uniref:major facilitator superfamily domain-containing protein n=1 Tax=Ilyonectria robusta TaxID=1079257 RepID=UPI001E8CAC8D|nr:major facilitator superfamily domain-containing protein [Ilyonectria robusta]KAH8736400.1 major facilitator superfamily domain-containing protein [Ilyonectria robusta]